MQYHFFTEPEPIGQKALADEPIPGFTTEIVLNKAVRKLNDQVQQTMERIIAETLMDYVRIRAHKNVRVDIRKPWWMPAAIHRWLIRQIVVIESPVEVTSTTELP